VTPEKIYRRHRAVGHQDVEGSSDRRMFLVRAVTSTMTALEKQPQFQILEYPQRKRSYLNASLPTLTFALFFLGLALPFFGNATAQQESSIQRKADLEIQKLELEVAKLQDETRPLPSWFTGIFGLKAETRGLPSWLTAVLTGVLGVVAGIVGTATTIWAARRTRRGALDQSVHDKRLESYPQLVRATHRLAVYFPPVGDPHTGLIGPKDVRRWGEPCRNGILVVVAYL
jgi:hypothetical protein